MGLNSFIRAQNLVPNPSFENYVTCPNDISQVNRLMDWQTPFNHLGTSDYYNSCATLNGFTLVGVPLNAPGYQRAATGNGYAGILFIEDQTPEYREYLQVKLLSPLIANKKYRVSYKCCLAEISFWTTDGIGVCLTVNPLVGNGTYNTLSATPQINSTIVITDTNKWTRVTQEFVSQGGEEYLTIGNFNNESNTLLVATGVDSNAPNSPIGYFYIDDVSVEVGCGFDAYLGNDTTICSGDTIKLFVNYIDAFTNYLWNTGSTDTMIQVTQPGEYSLTIYNDSCQVSDSKNVVFRDCGCQLFIPNAFTPNGDGLNDKFRPLGKCNYSDYDLRIFNRWGQLIFNSNDSNFGWDGDTKNEPAPIGTYFYLLRYKATSNEAYLKKGDITLIR